MGKEVVAKGLGEGKFQYEVTCNDTGHEKGPIFSYKIFSIYQFQGRDTRDYSVAHFQRNDYNATLANVNAIIDGLLDGGTAEEVKGAVAASSAPKAPF